MAGAGAEAEEAKPGKDGITVEFNGVGKDEDELGGCAMRWRCVNRNSAMEILFVECVDGKPYSRWCVPMAVRLHISAVRKRSGGTYSAG
jgi:hypothetical protein